MKPKKTIDNDSFIKAIKKADRELELEDNPGFKSKTKVHKSKKVYDRKNKNNDDFDEL